MSGYLAAIAARVSGGRPMLEPRPLARFEGDAPPGPPPQEQWLPAAPVVPPVEPLQRRAAAAVPVPQQPAKPLAPAGAVPATPPAATPRAKPVLPLPAQPARIPEPPVPRLMGHESPVVSRPAPAAAFATAQDSESALTESPPQARPPLSHPATALPVPLPVPQAGRAEAVARVPPSPPSSTARPRLDAPTTRQASRAAMADTGPAPAPVSVTIGRVEIRATLRAPQPAMPARPAAPDPTALSLDAYLRRRDGGSG
jgi:outer membrane lipoprotein SlyB